MSTNYIPRVTQLDAVHLDSQFEELFKQLVFEAAKFIEPKYLQPVLPEVELIIRTWIFKHSVVDEHSTFGHQMLSLKYNSENFPRSKLYWYYGYTIGLKYLKERMLYSFTTNIKVQNFVHKMEMFQLIGDTLNFCRFIQTGKYPVLIDFILGLHLSADKLTREDLTDLSWTRELLWHNFIELIGTTVSLMNIFGLKQKLAKVLKYVWWREHVRLATTVAADATMSLQTVCACCSNNPVLPHTMGCSHIFCYYCIMIVLLLHGWLGADGSPLAMLHATSSQSIVFHRPPATSSARPITTPPAVDQYGDSGPKYEYKYEVSDHETGDRKSHWESRDGERVRGVYTLYEPDGALRTVEYTADALHGFNAVVSRNEPSKHQHSHGGSSRQYLVSNSAQSNYDHSPDMSDQSKYSGTNNDLNQKHYNQGVNFSVVHRVGSYAEN